MSQSILQRLRAAIAGSRGVTVELPKAFIIEVLEAMETAAVRVPVVDLDALVRKQREWNDQVIDAYLQACGQKRIARGPRPSALKTRCVECEGYMFVLATRITGRKMMCLGCKRRVTIRTAQQPEKA